MDTIRKIEAIGIFYILIIASVVYLYDRSLSALIGGIFMLTSFHMLRRSFDSLAERTRMGWTFIKAGFHILLFYGTLVVLLLNPGLIKPIYFLIGTMSLFLAILTSAILFMER